MEQEVSDLIIFFGRFHPFFLHLPIGFLIIGVTLEILSRFKRYSQYKPAVGLVLYLGAASALVAAGLGYMLAQEGGYNEDLLSIHQWSGISLVIFTIVAALLHWQRQRNAAAYIDKVYITMLLLMMVTLTITGHYGGSLTHGTEYLTQYMPNGIRMVAGLDPKKRITIKKITNLEEAEVFNDIIYPILDSRCTSCHNSSKQKGDLMMHTEEALLKGGESGPILIAGNGEESEMIKRILLPENDEEHMPPKGKSQLTEEQIFLLQWWVDEGAPFNKTIAEVKVDEKAQAVLNTLVDPHANKTEVEKLLISKVQPADKQVINQLKEKGVQVSPLAADTYWLQSKISTDQPMDSLIPVLSRVSEQLTWLDLGGTPTTDMDLSHISKFNNLTRLHLENTKISGEGLMHLENLYYLEYLNLYGTPINDKDLQQLAILKNLKKLFVWQTMVTEEGAIQLQKALPGLEVNLGIEKKNLGRNE
jgi:uncharacterized membrane protein